MTTYPMRRALAAAVLALMLPAAALAVGQVGETAAAFTHTSTEGDSYTFGVEVGQAVGMLFFVGHN